MVLKQVSVTPDISIFDQHLVEGKNVPSTKHLNLLPVQYLVLLLVLSFPDLSWMLVSQTGMTGIVSGTLVYSLKMMLGNG